MSLSDARVAFAAGSLPGVPTLPDAPTLTPLLPATQPARLERGVLIVDDDYESAWCLAALLETALHCPVRTATDGAEALDAAIDMHPDFIVMDLDMPGVDGLEAARLLHALLPGDRPRLVALTALDQPADRARTREAGFLAHLGKPVDVQRLLDLLSGTA